MRPGPLEPGTVLFVVPDDNRAMLHTDINSTDNGVGYLNKGDVAVVIETSKTRVRVMTRLGPGWITWHRLFSRTAWKWVNRV